MHSWPTVHRGRQRARNRKCVSCIDVGSELLIENADQIKQDVEEKHEIRRWMLSTSRIMWKSSTCMAVSNLQQSDDKFQTISHWYVSVILKQWNSFTFRTLQFHQQGIHQVVLYKTQLIICATCWRTQKCTASNPCRMVKYTKQNGRLLHCFNIIMNV